MEVPLQRSARIGLVDDLTMTDAQHSNRLPAVAESVENAIDANPKRQDALEPAAESMAEFRISLEQGQGVEDGFGKTRGQRAELRSRQSCQDDTSHRLRPSEPLRMFGSNLIERMGATRLEVCPTATDIGERLRVRQNLGRLLERLVLVDRYDRRCRTATPSHDDMLTQIRDLIEESSQLRAELTNGNGLGHDGCSVPAKVHGPQASEEEPRALRLEGLSLFHFSSGGGTRTHNLRINSPPRCQLRHPGKRERV